MAHQDKGTVFETVMELLTDAGFDQFAEAFRLLVNQSMRIQREQALGAGPYERTDSRAGYANGFKPKTVATRMGKIQLDVPQVRGPVSFYPSALERGVCSERAIKLAVAEMYVQGVSTRKVTRVMEQLCGLEVSSTQVSEAVKLLDEELGAWCNRRLDSQELPYLVLDARYEKVRVAGCVRDCAVLIAIGLRADGRRTVLGVSVSLSEAEVHWSDFLGSLKARGLHGTRYIVSDDHPGLRAARQAQMTGIAWNRCQFHLQQNLMKYVPKVSMRSEVAAGVRDIFEAPNRTEADLRLKKLVEHYYPIAPQMADWIEENISEGLTVFILPASHRKRMRTTNMLENLNKQIKRRTRVVCLFPNEASILRLVSAVLMETSEEWESGKRYLNMDVKNDWPVATS